MHLCLPLLPKCGRIFTSGTLRFEMVASTTMYTAFSDAVTAERQGWSLGVAGSVMAIAWVVTGLLTNLLSVFGETRLLLIGGLSFLFSALVMLFYGRRRTVTHSGSYGPRSSASVALKYPRTKSVNSGAGIS
jgi:hypothetical protein